MAMLAGYGTFLLEAVIPQVQPRERVLSVARMAVTWDADDLASHLDRLGLDHDPAMLERIRTMGHQFTTRELFELLRFEEYQDIDIDEGQGTSIVHDLNQPVPAALEQRFDLVVENGTIEHIFDLKTVMGSIARMVKVGGWVSHASPMDAFNHGFYNFSLNFFHDFYRANGFDDPRFFLVRYAANWHEVQSVLVEPVEYTHEEFYVSSDVYTTSHNKYYVASIARKREHVGETRVPIQGSYDTERGLDSRLTR